MRETAYTEYPALIFAGDMDDSIMAYFPDLGIMACGFDMEETISNAKDLLASCLSSGLNPKPSTLSEVEMRDAMEGDLVMMIEATKEEDFAEDFIL